MLSEVIGPYTVQSAPASASLVSGGGGITNWLNVVNAPVSINDAYSGFSLIDRGYANFTQGSVVQMNFASGTLVNGPGPDLLLLDGRYSFNSYSVSTSQDGFATQFAVSSSDLTDTGVRRSYYYGQDNGPYPAMVMADAIDLSNLGVPAGASVASVRVTTTNSEADLLDVGALSLPTKVTIDINDTSAQSDDITLYNPSPLSQVYAQTVPAKITNTDTAQGTFTLSVVPSSAATFEPNLGDLGRRSEHGDHDHADG